MIDKISYETILHIGRFLTHHDYYQLVLVSKPFYNIFTPLLYSHVTLPMDQYNMWGFNGHVEINDLPIRRFTQAIIENPSLAPLVQSIELYSDRCMKYWNNMSKLDPLPAESYPDTFIPYGFSRRQRKRLYRRWKMALWNDGLGFRTDRLQEDAWLSLLLLRLPNLRRICFPDQDWVASDDTFEIDKLSVFFYRLIKWAGDAKLGVLTNITHISLGAGPVWTEGDRGCSRLHLHRLIPFLQIPSLRTLRVYNVVERHAAALPEDITSSITHLHFEQVYEHLHHMPQLLSMCPNLQCFTWRQEDPHEEHGKHNPGTHDLLNPTPFYAPLSKARDSLRCLKIGFEAYLGSEDIWQDIQSPKPRFLGSLLDFSVLETIQMRWANLLHFEGGAHCAITPLWEILPYSLKFVYIEDCLVQSSSMLCCELETLITHLPSCLPHLQTLYIQFALHERKPGPGCYRRTGRCGGPLPEKIGDIDPVTEDRLKGLKGKFQRLNVEFRVLDRGPPVPFPS